MASLFAPEVEHIYYNIIINIHIPTIFCSLYTLPSYESNVIPAPPIKKEIKIFQYLNELHINSCANCVLILYT